MMRIFIDSNILISAILFPKGVVAEVFYYILEHHNLIISNLASAILSSADVLLTGDKDFKAVDLKSPLVFTPGEYYFLISKNKNPEPA